VRHSHKEARLSIEPISPETLEEVDLLSALENSARTMLEGGSVKVKTRISGTPRTIAPKISIPMLRIGQEAIANAVRHADPSYIHIDLHHGDDFVRLEIKDDGCGFVKSGGLLGFGLRGMRTRAAALSAKLEITSEPGEGTCVQVIAPVPPNLTLFKTIQKTWEHYAESIFHVDAKSK
jgi:signal transduction histidine kinase